MAGLFRELSLFFFEIAERRGYAKIKKIKDEEFIFFKKQVLTADKKSTYIFIVPRKRVAVYVHEDLTNIMAMGRSICCEEPYQSTKGKGDDSVVLFSGHFAYMLKALKPKFERIIERNRK